ncbi:MAG TPA: hypothetical protein VF535_15330 [Allosphingosinicella sp.]|jgi:hypothetical protein
MLTIRDWAPLIGVGLVAANGLFFVWLSVRQAHSGERKAAREAKRRVGLDAGL